MTLVRLLPPQPRPARSFAPVPTAPSDPISAVWLDRELIWIGHSEDLQGAVETFPWDRLDTEPGLPPWSPRPLDDREVCVGTAVRADHDEHLDELAFEIDCDLIPLG